MKLPEDIALKRPRVDELDGLRAILALWVVAAHILNWSGFDNIKLPHSLQYFWTLFLDGGAAVDVFIILSGFAIAFLLNGRSQTFLQFMTGRFFRIYPVYLFCLILAFFCTYLIPFLLETASWKGSDYFVFQSGIHAAEQANRGGHLFWHLTLLNGLLPKAMFPNGSFTLLFPAWSISLEWQFYLFAPFIVRMVRSGAGILALIVLSLLGQYVGQDRVSYAGALLPVELPVFLVGIGSYYLYEWYCRAGQPRSRLYILPVAALLAFAAFTGWHLAALAVWAAVFGSVFVRGDDLLSRLFSVLRRLLLHPWLQWTGRASYSLYLIHWPLILVLLFVLLRWQPDLSSGTAALWLFLIGSPLILGVTALLHTCVELPGMAVGKKLAYRGQDNAATKAVAEKSLACCEKN